jgi:hypothetical protein
MSDEIKTADKDAESKVVEAIHNLIRVATRHKMAVVGFVFSVDPPFISNFGNTTGAQDIKTYERLVGICNEKRSEGKAISMTVTEVN